MGALDDLLAEKDSDSVKSVQPAPRGGSALDALLAERDQPKLGHPDNPIGRNVFGDDTSRAASSFGNDSGVGKMLASKGYQGAQRNAKGELVFKNADGNFYKDEDNFLGKGDGISGYLPDHPLNWAESHLGKALPMIGMMAGGAAGAAGGAGAAGVGSIPGAMGGAAAGAMGGEGLRQAAGRSMGVYDGDATESAKDAVTEGLSGGLTEGFGRAVAPLVNPYIDAGLGQLGKLAKGAVSNTSSFLTGVPKEAIERLIERPSSVLGAEADGNALDVARKAREEFLTRNSDEGKAIQDARGKFRDRFGSQTPDNAPIKQSITDFESHNAPNAQGFGPVSDGDMKQLQGVSSSLDSASAGDLQKLADHLGTQINNFEQARAPGSGDTRSQAYLRNLYGQIKEQLHTMDPNGLGAADKQFSNYAQDAGRVGKLENPDQMEGFINNYYGKNKTLMRESAQRLIPDSGDDIADIGASRAFSAQGPAGSEMGRRAMLGAGAGLMGMATGLAHGSGGEMAMGAAAAGVTSPGIHKAVIGRTSQALEAIQGAPWFQAIKNNPILLDSISNPELKNTVTQLLGGASNAGGSVLQKAADSDSPSFMDRFKSNPELVDKIQNEGLRSQVKQRLGREPSGVSSERVDPEDAKQKFLEGN